MGILIDTSVLIAAERGRFDIDRLIQSHPTEVFCISAISASELLVGVERTPVSQRQKRSEYVEESIARLTVIPFDLAVARVHAQLAVQMMMAGRPVGVHDLQIAATAVTRGDRIAALDQRSFPHVPGVTLLDLSNLPT